MGTISINASVRPTETAPFARGWDASYDANTQADYYVDASVSSSGDGTTVGTAFKTISEAVSQAVTDAAARTIAIVDGTYRESLSLGSLSAGCHIKGYGADKPIITAQNSLTGWTQCSAADSTELGATLGVADSPVWKVTLANSSMADSPANLNIHENGEPMPICQTQTGDKFFFSHSADFNRADSFTVNGSNQVTAITDADVLSGITSAQLADAYVYIYATGNFVYKVGITAYAGSTVDVDGLKTPASADADDLRWNLTNCPPKLVAGTWAWMDNGDSTTTIYAYPTDAANLTANMSYAARSYCIDLGLVENITLEGLQILGAAGSGTTGGVCVHKSSGSTKTSGHLIRHCKIGNVHYADTRGYGPVYLRYVGDTTMERCTLENGAGTFGSFFQGGTGDVPGTGNIVRQCQFKKTAQAATRVYTQEDFQYIRNDMYKVGLGSHGNCLNFYSSCDDILVFGCKSRESGGYVTFNTASKLMFLFNDFEAKNGDDTRALVDQSSGAIPPTCPSLNYVCNNMFAPSRVDPEGAISGNTKAVTLGNHYETSYGTDIQPENISFWMDNNIIHGGGIEEAYTAPSAGETYWRDQVGYDDTHIERSREGNVYSALLFWQDIANGWSANASEVVNETLASVYTDAANGDFSAPSGSPILTTSGVSLATALAAAEAAFPSFDFTKDADGYSYTRTAPKVGPYQSSHNTQVARSIA